jgi:hypothetical protein
MASLLDPDTGFHRRQQLRDLGLDLKTQFKALIRRVFHLEQAVARVRKFRGLIAEEDNAHITPDQSERIKVHSPDSSIRIYSGPDGGSHDMALEVNPDVLDFCEASICTVVGTTGTYTATECCETLTLASTCLNIVVDGSTITFEPTCGWFSEIVTGDGTVTAADCCESVTIVGTGCVNVAVGELGIEVGLICGMEAISTLVTGWSINGVEQVTPDGDCGCGCLDFVDSDAICFKAVAGAGDCTTGVEAYPIFEATQLFTLPEPSAIYKIKLCDGSYLYVQGYIGP